MRKIKSIIMLLAVIVLGVFSIGISPVSAAEKKANIFSGDVHVSPWNMAVSMSSIKDGGTLDTSVFKDKGYFYIQYTGEKEGLQLILQCWSGSDGWTLAQPSEVGETEDGLNYAKFDENSIKAVYKSSLTALDALHLWNTKGSFTLKSIDYISDDTSSDITDDPVIKDPIKEPVKDPEVTDKDDKDMKVVSATEDNIRYMGRGLNYKNQLWLAPSASGAEFMFTGTKVEITFLGDWFAAGENVNNARVAVYVNDKRVVDKMITKEETTLKVFESEEPETVKINVVKLSESANGTLGIKEIKIDKDGKVAKTENKSKTIEFIGDSITCAYGVDDENKDNHFTTHTEDVTKSYAYKTAKALDADFSITAYSGYGIVSGYSGTGVKNDKELLPKYYDKIGFSYGAFASELSPEELEWDFDKFQPDMVVINLGTNDSNYCNSDEHKAEFVEGYVEFLKTVREKNPNAKILCTLGVMGDALYESIEEAVANYGDLTGDMEVYTLRFPLQDYQVDGLAADWHPTEKKHTKVAAKLTEKIKEIMSW